MKALVTGGTGFIGAHLVRRLLARGHEVVCLVRPSSRLENLQDLPVKLAFGDLCKIETLRPAAAGCNVVYHCAADYRLWCRDPENMHASNVEGTRNTLQVAFDEGVRRVVYTSTVGCLGSDPDGRPADENTPVVFEKLTGPYKRSKFLAEREAESWARRGLPVVIVNPSTPVGDLDAKPTPTGRMIVDFLRLAAEKGKPGEKYILGHRNLTLKEIFDLLSQLTGIPSPTRQLPHWVAEAYATVENFWSEKVHQREPTVPLDAVRLARHKMWFDSSRAVAELGLRQAPVEHALERAVRWFQSHGYI
jgi:dihydroflavonol-4-reductase